MNIWESTVLTDKGTALQAKLVDGQTLQITRVMTGAVKVPVVNLRQQKSVTGGGKEITLQPCRIEGDQMVVPVLLENKEMEKGYDLWQVGIYAQDPDEGEILYCLAQASEAKHIPSAAEGPGFSITWDFCFKTSNTAPFDITLNPVGLVNIEQYQVHTAEIGSLKSSIVDLDGRIEELNADLHNVTADFTTVTGTFITNSGFTNLKYPSGFKQDNCIVVAIEVLYESWRGGYGLNNANDPSRLFTILDPKEIRVYCNSTTHMVDKQFRVLLKKIGI